MRISLLRFFVFGLSILPVAVAVGQTLDPGFQPTELYRPAPVKAAVPQPDGKTLVLGVFARTEVGPDRLLLRYNADNSLDQAFCANVATLRGDVSNVRVLASGRLLLIGEGTLTLGGLTRQDLLQLNADGTADAGFDAGLASSSGGVGRSSAVQPDGKILVGGSFTSYNGTAAQRLVRLLPTGAVDATFTAGTVFNNSIEDVALQADGKVLVGGVFTAPHGIARLLPSGVLDNTFASPLVSANSRITMIGVQPNGNILLGTGGFYMQFTDGTRSVLSRLLPDGTRDPAFAVPSFGAYSPVYDLYDSNEFLIQPDGRILVGVQGRVGAPQKDWLIRLNANGTRDATFASALAGSDFPTQVHSLQQRANGQLLIGGTGFLLNGRRGDVALLNADGSLDNTFSPALLAAGHVYNLAQQPDGKVLVSGLFDEAAGIRTRNVARYNADGSLDAAFTGQAATNFIVYQMVRQPDGKVLLLGSVPTTRPYAGNFIVRLLPTGAIDNSFQAPPALDVYQIVLQPDGRIVMTNGLTISRLTADGQLDSTFPVSESDGFVYTLLSQPDGKILVGGSWDAFNSQPVRALVRLQANGQLDTSFSSPIQTTATVEVAELLLQPDGKIVAGGYTDASMTPAQQAFGLFRMLPDGATDNAFVSSLPVSINNIGFVRGLTLQPNGRLLVATFGAGVVRKLANGQPDPSFSALALNGDVEDILVQTNGRILVGGYFTSVNGQRALGLAGLSASNVLGTNARQINAPTDVWPNPAHEVVQVKMDAAARPLSVELLDAVGKVVLAQPAAQLQMSLPLRTLKPGVYLLRVNYARGPVMRRVVIR
ncbi:T9SS type A sorting domain-containing protein [Hymenobacter algoricola]|uniref:Secretion system C-terminal sorting domain-containing protein n=1 Tax=Hymenobacter algoricola TaxID=486267 RepID=A0ABP7NH53_9BACT